MSNSTMPSKSKPILITITVLLLAFLAAAIKMYDQKDQQLKDAKVNFDEKLVELKERHKEKCEELKTDLSTAQEELREATRKYNDYRELYEGASVRTAELEKYLKEIEKSGGVNSDSLIALAKLRGDLQRYQSTLATAEQTIAAMEQEIHSLKTDLVVAQERIVSLTGSLSIARNELEQNKDIAANSITAFVDARLLEISADALPNRKRYQEEKVSYYQRAKIIIISVQQRLQNENLAETMLQELNAKMENVKAGSSAERKRAF